jgi:PIN domain nuclease of toxin-antitoxin system
MDTHIWIWWLLGSDRLSAAERHGLDRLAATGGVHLSAMSLWEAQMLQSKGRLKLDRPLAAWLRQAAAPGVVALLPLDVEVVLALDQLPQSFHGDPADRLIVATALTHGLPLATQDSAIHASDVIPIWEPST